MSSEAIRDTIRNLTENYQKGGINALYSAPMSIFVYAVIVGLVSPTPHTWAFVGGYIFNEFMGTFFGLITALNTGFSETAGKSMEGSVEMNDGEFEMGGGGSNYDEMVMFDGRVPSYYGINFGYVTGFFLYKYIYTNNYKGALSLVFVTVTISIAIAIFSKKSKISMMVGYLIGMLIGYLICNVAYSFEKATKSDTDSDQVRKPCSSDENEDYVCQSFRDGLLIHDTSDTIDHSHDEYSQVNHDH